MWEEILARKQQTIQHQKSIKNQRYKTLFTSLNVHSLGAFFSENQKSEVFFLGLAHQLRSFQFLPLLLGIGLTLFGVHRT